MASTYSTNLAFELMATGDQSGTWGVTNNTNIGTLIEQSISGYVTQAITDGADTVITIPNGATGVARNMYIECTGALTANRNLVVPANKKLYFVYNNTTGGFAVTVKVTGLTGISVPNGKKIALVSNGTDIFVAENYLVGNVTGSSGSTTGNAATATALQTARNINGTSFNGTADITVTAAAGTLTGATLNSTVLTSSLTTVGTLGSLSVTGTATAGAFSGPLTGNVTGNCSGSSGSCTGNAATATSATSATSATTATTATTANALNTSNNYQVNSIGVGTAGSGTAGEIRATNNITAFYTSDMRLKTNVVQLTNALDRVCSLGGYSFEWSKDYIDAHGGEDEYFLKKDDVGVIAQEVQAVLPLAVRTRDDGTLAVAYEKLIPLLIESIKELTERVRTLEAARDASSQR